MLKKYLLTDLVGVNKDSYLVLDTLPAEYDSRVKAMEVDERPTEEYTDVGGLDVQIQELQVFFFVNSFHCYSFCSSIFFSSSLFVLLLE
jgi:ATP-dependent 26S proteasome regulatory subunit